MTGEGGAARWAGAGGYRVEGGNNIAVRGGNTKIEDSASREGELWHRRDNIVG